MVTNLQGLRKEPIRLAIRPETTMFMSIRDYAANDDVVHDHCHHCDNLDTAEHVLYLAVDAHRQRVDQQHQEQGEGRPDRRTYFQSELPQQWLLGVVKRLQIAVVEFELKGLRKHADFGGC